MRRATCKCRRKSRFRTGSLTRCEIVSKRGLLVLNLQKPTAPKALQMRRLSAFAFETITLQNFEKKLYEANASVKRNTVNTIKQLISLKLAMKIQGERWSSKGGALLVQDVWYVNAWNYSKKLIHSVSFWVGLDKVKRALMLIICYKILSFSLWSWFFSTATHLWLCFLFCYT